VSAVIALLSIGQGVEHFINNQFNALGTNLLFVQSKLGSSQAAQYLANLNFQTSLTQNDSKALGDPLQVQDTAGTAAIIRLDALVRYANSNLVSTVRGATTNYAEARSLKIEVGRFISDDDNSAQLRVAVIGKTVVDQLFPQDLTPIDRYIKINDIPFRVIGILAAKGGNQFANDDNQVIVPLNTARTQLRDVRAKSGLAGVSSILIQSDSANSADQVKTDAIDVLRQRHNISYRNEDDFRVFSQSDLLSTFGQISAAITVFLSAIAGISLLVGGIGVMNIMLVTVTERTREIGLRKALGAKRRDILVQFLIEAMTLSLIGGAIGIAIGVGTAIGISSLSDQFQASISIVTILLATGVSASVGLIAGLYPAARAARLNPIDALRYE
ncbi:MAG TPA: ABC transporter permease, partial [Anaerolineae bacterium]|nr:ABC transporter permease [Anaerolineae bacterium]